MAHTGSTDVLDYTINGVSLGEPGYFALCAGELGVPTLFGSGDEAFCREMNALMPWMRTVAVKRGLRDDDGSQCDAAQYAAHNLGVAQMHPCRARALIHEGARKALEAFAENRAAFRPLRLQPPYQRIVLYRRVGDTPAHTCSASHPGSVIALMNTPDKPAK
jgi:D-aminopeptidase